MARQRQCAGTPTRPALEGALTYAHSIKTSMPSGSKVAVVLVTDGLPAGCGDTEAVAMVARASATDIPTYVIGVGAGRALMNLQTMAAAGGTSAPFLIDVKDPMQITGDFEKTLERVRGAAASCAFAIPAAPDGMELDPNAVNVSVSGSALSYSKDCQGGTGWHYDDADHPGTVELCPASCGAAKASTTGKIDVVFGCATRGGVTK
jgi:hypothetical protein